MKTAIGGQKRDTATARHRAAAATPRRALARSFWVLSGSHAAAGRRLDSFASLVLHPALPGRHTRIIHRRPNLAIRLAVLRHRLRRWTDHPLVGTRRAELVAAGVVVGWALLVYLATNSGLASRILSMLGVDPAHPIAWQAVSAMLWGSLAAVAIHTWRHRISHRPRGSRAMPVLAFLTAVFQIALLMLAGMALGLGNSPYSHDFLPTAGNVLYFLSVIIALEAGRACVVAALRRWNDTLALGVATLFFGILALPLARLSFNGGPESVLATTGEYILPTLSQGLLASFIVLIGGPIGAIIYQGTLGSFELLSPVLPDLQWPVIAFLGTLAPLVGLWVFRQSTVAPAPEPSGSARDADSPRTDLGWLSVGVIAVTMLWLVTGMFGVQPFIISGPSMQPTLHAGDLVIVRDVDPAEIGVGDVIRFRKGGLPVIHRVVDLDDSGARPVFITRGDNNNQDDPPVPAANVDGEVVASIPKLGWPSIWIRRLIGGAA